jgi:hypothetical protein
LRTVVPRQDTALVQAVCGGMASHSDRDTSGNPISPT